VKESNGTTGCRAGGDTKAPPEKAGHAGTEMVVASRAGHKAASRKRCGLNTLFEGQFRLLFAKNAPEWRKHDPNFHLLKKVMIRDVEVEGGKGG